MDDLDTAILIYLEEEESSEVDRSKKVRYLEIDLQRHLKFKLFVYIYGT